MGERGPVDAPGPGEAEGVDTGRRLRELAREVMLLVGLFLVYRFGRLLATDHVETARAHALVVHSFERAARLPAEASIQAAMSGEILRLANIYYVSMHFTIIVTFLVWGYLRRPRAQYLWARNLLIVQTSLALVLHIAFPLAPPRMFPQWGFLDSMSVLGPSAYEGASASAANQYAAMPSLHIGWALLVAYVLLRTAPPILKALGVTHAVLTIAVVVVTANHWWVDGLVSAILLAIAVVAVPAYRAPSRSDASVPDCSWTGRSLKR